MLGLVHRWRWSYVDCIKLRSKLWAIVRSKSAQQQRLAAASQLMASTSPPYSAVAANKCMNLPLQQQQSDTQRATAALMMGEDMHKFGRSRLDRNEFLMNGGLEMVNPGSGQIYLTFPASTFRDKDVSNYSSIYGPVQDVRIPYQPMKHRYGYEYGTGTSTGTPIRQNSKNVGYGDAMQGRERRRESEGYRFRVSGDRDLDLEREIVKADREGEGRSQIAKEKADRLWSLELRSERDRSRSSGLSLLAMSHAEQGRSSEPSELQSRKLQHQQQQMER